MNITADRIEATIGLRWSASGKLSVSNDNITNLNNNSSNIGARTTTVKNFKVSVDIASAHEGNPILNAGTAVAKNASDTPAIIPVNMFFFEKSVK